MANHKNIKIISVGPGGIDFLTPASKKAIENAEIIICHDSLKHFVPEGKKIFIPEKIVTGTIDLIHEHMNMHIGVLVSGDAGFFSLSKAIVKNFGIDKVEIFAGVSSAQIAFAKLGESWNDSDFFSVHGRKNLFNYDGKKCLVLCDSENSPNTVLTQELFDNYNIFIFEDLTAENEKISNPKSLNEIKYIRFSSRTIIVMIRTDGE